MAHRLLGNFVGGRGRDRGGGGGRPAAAAAAAAEEYDDVNNGAAAAQQEPDDDNDADDNENYHSFRTRQAKGTLFKIPSMDGPVKAKLTAYIKDGAMDNDLRYVREVFGLVNTGGRKEFDQFWESPWVEEHIHDAAKKRKLDAQQRSIAVRAYIRQSSTAAEPESVDKYLDTVDKLTEWEDRHGAKDLVKTVSRMVQSFERAALTYLISVLDAPACRTYAPAVRALVDPAQIETDTEAGADITSVACTLRRSSNVFHLFAATVAAEIIWSEATNGSRNTTIYLCRQLEEKRLQSAMGLIRGLHALRVELRHDTLGMPLMHVNASMCVSRGVLVVMPGSVSATYILDITDSTTDLMQVKNIKITHVVDEPPPPPAEAAARRG